MSAGGLDIKLIFSAGVLVGAVLGMPIGAIVGSPAADADANSYLAYIHDHQIFTGTQTDAWLVKSGLNACELLHQGMTIDQISQGLSFADAHGLAVGAQRELCPETAH